MWKQIPRLRSCKHILLLENLKKNTDTTRAFLVDSQPCNLKTKNTWNRQQDPRKILWKQQKKSLHFLFGEWEVEFLFLSVLFNFFFPGCQDKNIPFHMMKLSLRKNAYLGRMKDPLKSCQTQLYLDSTVLNMLVSGQNQVHSSRRWESSHNWLSNIV